MKKRGGIVIFNQIVITIFNTNKGNTMKSKAPEPGKQRKQRKTKENHEKRGSGARKTSITKKHQGKQGTAISKTSVVLPVLPL